LAVPIGEPFEESFLVPGKNIGEPAQRQSSVLGVGQRDAVPSGHHMRSIADITVTKTNRLGRNTYDEKYIIFCRVQWNQLTQICHSNTLVNMMHHCNITQINHTSI
jgi:hypothetical protein